MDRTGWHRIFSGDRRLSLCCSRPSNPQIAHHDQAGLEEITDVEWRWEQSPVLIILCRSCASMLQGGPSHFSDGPALVAGVRGAHRVLSPPGAARTGAFCKGPAQAAAFREVALPDTPYIIARRIVARRPLRERGRTRTRDGLMEAFGCRSVSPAMLQRDRPAGADTVQWARALKQSRHGATAAG